MRFKLRRIGGVSYYPGMMRLLQALEDAGARFEMYHVGAVPPRTRRALEQRDWAVFNGDYALITARGAQALDTYLNTPPRERDRVFCARCGQRPRYVCNNHVYTYCHDCYAQVQRASRKRRAFARVLSAHSSGD